MDDFNLFNFPIIRRAVAKTIAFDLVKVQPMGMSEEELRELRRREEIKKRGKKIQKILDRIKKENS